MTNDTDLILVDFSSVAQSANSRADEALHELRDMAGGTIRPDSVVFVAEKIQELSATVAGLAAALQSATQQRDNAMWARVDVVAAIAENMNWTHETVHQLFALMLNSDHQLLADDVAHNHAALAALRDAFSRMDVDLDSVLE